MVMSVLFLARTPSFAVELKKRGPFGSTTLSCLKRRLNKRLQSPLPKTHNSLSSELIHPFLNFLGLILWCRKGSVLVEDIFKPLLGPL